MTSTGPGDNPVAGSAPGLFGVVTGTTITFDTTVGWVVVSATVVGDVVGAIVVGAIVVGPAVVGVAVVDSEAQLGLVIEMMFDDRDPSGQATS